MNSSEARGRVVESAEAGRGDHRVAGDEGSKWEMGDDGVQSVPACQLLGVTPYEP